jgi:hypothetical protein
MGGEASAWLGITHRRVFLTLSIVSNQNHTEAFWHENRLLALILMT